jgi:hypothetical protein
METGSIESCSSLGRGIDRSSDNRTQSQGSPLKTQNGQKLQEWKSSVRIQERYPRQNRHHHQCGQRGEAPSVLGSVGGPEHRHLLVSGPLEQAAKRPWRARHSAPCGGGSGHPDSRTPRGPDHRRDRADRRRPLRARPQNCRFRPVSFVSLPGGRVKSEESIAHPVLVGVAPR